LIAGKQPDNATGTKALEKNLLSKYKRFAPRPLLMPNLLTSEP